jgi:Tol biopolymer transport system component
VSSTGTQGNGNSGHSIDRDIPPAISADGRYVDFASDASNLVPGDTCCTDVFVHDRTTGETTRVSVANGGGQADGKSYNPSISANGRYVAFVSEATNLEIPSHTQGGRNVFVRDRTLRTTRPVNIGCLHRAIDPSISSDGRYVAFMCLPPRRQGCGWEVWVRDRTLHTTANITPRANGASGPASISADGRLCLVATLLGSCSHAPHAPTVTTHGSIYWMASY